MSCDVALKIEGRFAGAILARRRSSNFRSRLGCLLGEEKKNISLFVFRFKACAR